MIYLLDPPVAINPHRRGTAGPVPRSILPGPSSPGTRCLHRSPSSRRSQCCRTIIPPAAIRVVLTEGGQPWLSWIYRTRGRLADYGFSIEFQPDIGWRVYVIFQTFHHDDNGSLHLPYRSIGHNGRRYIDWPGKLNGLGEAKTVAGLWVELIQHYLRIQERNAVACHEHGTCGCRTGHPRRATWAYSRINPLSRSRRRW